MFIWILSLSKQGNTQSFTKTCQVELSDSQNTLISYCQNTNVLTYYAQLPLNWVLGPGLVWEYMGYFDTDCVSCYINVNVGTCQTKLSCYCNNVLKSINLDEKITNISGCLFANINDNPVYGNICLINSSAPDSQCCESPCFSNSTLMT